MADATFNGKRVELLDLPENVTTIDGKWERQITQHSEGEEGSPIQQADYKKIGLSEQEEAVWGRAGGRIRIGEIAGKEVAQQESDPNSTINKIIKEIRKIHESDYGVPGEPNFVPARHDRSPFRVIFKLELKAQVDKVASRVAEAKAQKEEEEKFANEHPEEAANLAEEKREKVKKRKEKYAALGAQFRARERRNAARDAVKTASGLSGHYDANTALRKANEALYRASGGVEGKAPRKEGAPLTTEQRALLGQTAGQFDVRTDVGEGVAKNMGYGQADIDAFKKRGPSGTGAKYKQDIGGGKKKRKKRRKTRRKGKKSKKKQKRKKRKTRRKRRKTGKKSRRKR